MLSLAVYVLTASGASRRPATEAAFKYFLLGAFSSAFFLYGIAFTYGVAGSTRLDRIGAAMSRRRRSPRRRCSCVALGLLLVGFAFKVSAVPFHMWTPDAYEGAPAVVTGFMSTGVKAAAFAAFARVFLSAFEPLAPDWAPVVWMLAAADDDCGDRRRRRRRPTSSACWPTRASRTPATCSWRWSPANDIGKGAILFYLLAYAVTQPRRLRRHRAARKRASGRNDRAQRLRRALEAPAALAALMTIFLLSLGGFPPTAGFIAKWYVFSAAVSAGDYGSPSSAC